MTLMPSAQPVASQYGFGMARPRPMFEALRETLASFLVHFWLF